LRRRRRKINIDWRSARFVRKWKCAKYRCAASFEFLLPHVI